jgi:hypothetical protein
MKTTAKSGHFLLTFFNSFQKLPKYFSKTMTICAKSCVKETGKSRFVFNLKEENLDEIPVGMIYTTISAGDSRANSGDQPFNHCVES